MGVEVGRIERQECFVWILRMGGVGDRRQFVHKVNFKCVALVELQTRAAIQVRRTGFGRAIIRSIMGV